MRASFSRIVLSYNHASCMHGVLEIIRFLIHIGLFERGTLTVAPLWIDLWDKGLVGDGGANIAYPGLPLRQDNRLGGEVFIVYLLQ